MTLPNFLHIGAAKAASTWLWCVCQEHPDIYVPQTVDNANFFTVHYHRGLPWYTATYFAGYDGERAIGEFSNSYMVYPPAMERLAHELPDVRLTAILRNPVERAFMSWAHQHLKQKPTGLDMRRGIGTPFDKVLHHVQSEIVDAVDPDSFDPWYVIMGVEIPGLYSLIEISDLTVAEERYLNIHADDKYHVSWPDHVITPKYNGDANYQPAD